MRSSWSGEKGKNLVTVLVYLSSFTISMYMYALLTHYLSLSSLLEFFFMDYSLLFSLPFHMHAYINM